MTSEEKIRLILSLLDGTTHDIEETSGDLGKATFIQWEFGKGGLATFTVYDDGYSSLVTSGELQDPVIAGLLTINFDKLCEVAESMYQKLYQKCRPSELADINEKLKSIGIELD